MSEALLLETRSNPRRKLVKEMTHHNMVRVYRSSPEDVTLQLRRTVDYCGVSLTFDEAQQVAAALLAAVGES